MPTAIVGSRLCRSKLNRTDVKVGTFRDLVEDIGRFFVVGDIHTL